MTRHPPCWRCRAMQRTLRDGRSCLKILSWINLVSPGRRSIAKETQEEETKRLVVAALHPINRQYDCRQGQGWRTTYRQCRGVQSSSNSLRGW
eukprot:114714-Pelagomonas_calceolata.AAC.4